MSEPRSRSPLSETMPSLAEVQRDPTILTGLPLPVIVDLRRQITHLAADVDAVLYRTLTEVRTKDQRSDIEPDRLLTPEAAAVALGRFAPAEAMPLARALAFVVLGGLPLMLVIFASGFLQFWLQTQWLPG